MCSILVVIGEVGTENPFQVSLVQHNDVIQTLAADRTDQAFDVWILPGRSPRRDNLFNAHVGHTRFELVPVDAISIANQEARDFVVGECFDNLLCRPLGRRVLGHVEVDHRSSVMSQDDKSEQNVESSRRNREKVDCHDVLQVIVEECSPRW